MLTKKRVLLTALIALCVIVAAALAALLYWIFTPWSYARQVPAQERALRDQVVQCAQQWLGCNEADGSHRQIIDLYNAHTPLAQGYEVRYEDSWCSTFVSAVAIECELTHIIPTECGCERHIQLFMELGCWVEDDSYRPLPGDLIFYCGSDSGIGDCTGWSDHVGIVVGTKGPFLRVIEGNSSDRVQYTTILIDAKGIRGYAVPCYGQ